MEVGRAVSGRGGERQVVTQQYARSHIVPLFRQWQADQKDPSTARDHLSFWFWLRNEFPHLCRFKCQGYPDRKMRHWLLKDLGSVVDV